MGNKINMHHPKTIEEAINDIEMFFQADMWYAKGNEWKAEEDMLKYLEGHFNILRKEIKRISSKKTRKANINETKNKQDNEDIDKLKIQLSSNLKKESQNA